MKHQDYINMIMIQQYF